MEEEGLEHHGVEGSWQALVGHIAAVHGTSLEAKLPRGTLCSRQGTGHQEASSPPHFALGCLCNFQSRKPQKSIFFQFWRLEAQDQGVSRFGLFRVPSPQTADSYRLTVSSRDLCEQVLLLPLCVLIMSCWIKAQFKDLILT